MYWALSRPAQVGLCGTYAAYLITSNKAVSVRQGCDPGSVPAGVGAGDAGESLMALSGAFQELCPCRGLASGPSSLRLAS